MTDCNKRMQTGHVVTEDGKQYFVCGNNYIEISEYFAEKGKTLRDLIEDVILYTANNRATA